MLYVYKTESHRKNIMNHSFHSPEQKKAILSSLISPDVYSFYQLKKIQKNERNWIKDVGICNGFYSSILNNYVEKAKNKEKQK